MIKVCLITTRCKIVLCVFWTDARANCRQQNMESIGQDEKRLAQEVPIGEKAYDPISNLVEITVYKTVRSKGGSPTTQLALQVRVTNDVGVTMEAPHPTKRFGSIQVVHTGCS